MATSDAPALRWLDDDEQRAWRAHLDMQRRLVRRLDRELHAATGLSSSDYEILVNLSEAEGGRMRQYELADRTQWEASRLSHHLTRMCDRGLVERRRCETDQRGADVVLTALGRKTIEQAAPVHVAAVRRWFIDVATPAQLRAYRSLAECVSANLLESGAQDDAVGDRHA
jgi:DNA-binding MarR family transcriptional regulator